jgi:hypothetical protein
MKEIVVNYATPPNDKAWLVEQGPQTSVIRWQHSGLTQALANQWLGLPVVKAEDLKNGFGAAKE